MSLFDVFHPAGSRGGQHFAGAAPAIGVEHFANVVHHGQVFVGEQPVHETDLLDADAVCAEDIPPPPPLRALVVTIVAQDGFLDGLLAAAVRAGRIPPLELSTAHVREIPRRLAAEDFDLAELASRPT